MITFEYRFDVLPGKLRDYEKYTKGPGKDVWLRFKGVKGVRVFKSMLGGSSPQRQVQVDLESLAALEKILADEVPTIMMFSADLLTVERDRVRNHQQHPTGWYFGLIKTWLAD